MKIENNLWQTNTRHDRLEWWCAQDVLKMRWHSRSCCFVDCVHKASHIPRYKIPQGKVKGYRAYLAKVRKSWLPRPGSSNAQINGSLFLATNNGQKCRRKERRIGSDSFQESYKNLSSKRNISCFDHENLIALRNEKEIVVVGERMELWIGA